MNDLASYLDNASFDAGETGASPLTVALGKPPRLKVLVSAFAVSPIGGSEPGLGWNMVSRLARWHDVTVLCSPGMPGERNFRGEIEAALAEQGGIPGLVFHFVEPPLLSRWLQRESLLLRRTVYYVGYKAWQRAAFKMARSLHETQRFQLVHQLNITGYREPGYLWRLPVPFVWGPIDGAVNLRRGYFSLMSRQEIVFYACRNLMNGIQKRMNRRVRAAARTARQIWAIGSDNVAMVRCLWDRQAESVIESGATPRGGFPRAFEGTRPLRILWNGHHIGRKALPILLHALQKADASRGAYELVVLGSGPETVAWKRLANRLGIADRVRWTGNVLHSDVLKELERTDVLAHTSVLEGTPAVVLEALAFGVPVICHDACGMGIAVTEDCGIKIKLNDAESSIEGFCLALERLHGEAGLVARLSENALVRAQELSWDRTVRRFADHYADVVELAEPPLKERERS